jgi:2-aminoethylphosphonate-pyruvate transaminase
VAEDDVEGRDEFALDISVVVGIEPFEEGLVAPNAGGRTSDVGRSTTPSKSSGLKCQARRSPGQLDSRSGQSERIAIGNVPSQGVRAPYVNSTEGGAPPAQRAISSREPAAATTKGLADLFERAVPVQTPVVSLIGTTSTRVVASDASAGLRAPALSSPARAPEGHRRLVELLGSYLLRGHGGRPRPVLLCPGPVLLSAHVKRAVRNTNIGHREPEFSQLLLESAAMLKPVVGIGSADSSYRIAFITGSGTAANEAVLASVGASGPTLVVSNGEFGERLLATARLHNCDVAELRFAWQEAIDLEKVAEELERRQYHLVVVVHHETSSGMLNPIAAIARLAHQHGALIAVDAISSIGAEEIAVEEWGIDVLTGASGKALSAMPGVGIVVVKGSVLEQSASMSTGPQYLNLHTHCGYMRDHAQTPNTPAVHVFVSLHASLEESTLQGVAQARGVIHSRALFARERLTHMGLEYADYRGMNSSVLTCVLLPEHLSFEHLARHLKTRGIVVYNGKGALTDRMFQLGHIGALRKNDTRDALRQVQAVMRQGTQATARPLQFVPTERSTRLIS